MFSSQKIDKRVRWNNEYIRYTYFFLFLFLHRDATLLQRQIVTAQKKEKYQTRLDVIRADRDEQIAFCTDFNKILQAVLQVHETGRIQILRGV